jgi:polysaccharide biosynthesis protein PslG
VKLLVLTAALLLTLPAHAGALEFPRGFFGLQAWGEPSAAEFDAMGRARVDVVRFNLDWSNVEPHPGHRAWKRYDTLVEGMARNGITPLPVLYGTPSFAAEERNDPPIASDAAQAFGRFVTDATRRYGRGGDFWRLHPDLPYTPIVMWQVWNEPNFAAYWNGRPNARQYAALLSVARTAIRAADPRGRVMLAGLPESRGGMPISRYLAALYGVRGSRKLFDAVALNPYARDARGVVAAVKRVRRVMDAGGDTRKSIWLTELGWATAGPVSPFRTSLAGQARRLVQSYQAALALHRRYHVDAVVWFAWRDRALGAGERDWWAPHTGLFSLSGKAKPAWRAFTDLTGGLAR